MTWGMDISIFSGFKIDIDALAGVTSEGLRQPQISGKAMINIDTSSLFAWYLFTTMQLVSVLSAFYVVIQLRSMMIALQQGQSFISENALRIKRIGIVIIIWSFLNPLLQYFGWGIVVNEISFSSEAIQLYPAFQMNSMGILMGVLMMVLSGLLKEATGIYKEQELTI